jgi:hypothetical protein
MAPKPRSLFAVLDCSGTKLVVRITDEPNFTLETRLDVRTAGWHDVRQSACIGVWLTIELYASSTDRVLDAFFLDFSDFPCSLTHTHLLTCQGADSSASDNVVSQYGAHRKQGSGCWSLGCITTRRRRRYRPGRFRGHSVNTRRPDRHVSARRCWYFYSLMGGPTAMTGIDLARNSNS